MLLYYHCHCHGKVSEEHITLCGQNEIFFFSSSFFFFTEKWQFEQCSYESMSLEGQMAQDVLCKVHLHKQCDQRSFNVNSFK